MELIIPIDSKNKTKAILKLLNPFLANLTNKEIEIVSTMIDMDIEVLNKYSRADLRDKLNIDKYTFNNAVASLKSKKILIQSTVDLRLNPALKTYTNDSTYTIKFSSGE